MSTSAISSTSSASSAASTSTSTTDQLKSQDFFKLLVTELQQQDPLEPTKTADMIAQVSQIRSIELSQQLMSTLDTLSKAQRTAGTGEMLGKYVEAKVALGDGTYATVSGIVTGVQFGSDGVASLELDTGQVVSASDVTRIATADKATTAAKTSTATAKTTTATTPVMTSSKPYWLQGGFQL